VTVAAHLSAADIIGVPGVILMIAAYAGAQAGRLNPRRAPALLMNLVGSGLVIASLCWAFNLAAFLMELSWAAVALFGLARLARKGRKG
jgi:hypothetical protein